MAQDLGAAIAELKKDEAVEIVGRRLGKGGSPTDLLEECRRGMATVGERFQEGDYYLSELLLSAAIFKKIVAILQPHLTETASPEPRGEVVLATMQGDIHDLGKNIVATLLSARGFKVHDLGADVPPAALIEKVEQVRPDFVGFSALITTAFESMKEAADLLVGAGLRDGVKLLVGGGVTTEAVREYVGADFQTVDAMDGVDYCLRIMREDKHGG